MSYSLTGKRIVVTRAEGQTADLIAQLRTVGADMIVFPTVEIVPLDDYADLEAALGHLHDYAWVIFTSVNGVNHVMTRSKAGGRSPADFNACRVVAVGAATEVALRNAGVEVALRFVEYNVDTLLKSLAEQGAIAGKRVLLLRVDSARAVLRDGLMAAGALVDEVPVYRTAIGKPDAAAYAELRKGVDVITFTSSATVRNFFTLLGDEALTVAGNAKIACIGPITAQTARQCGLHVDFVASETTMSGLIHALEAALSDR